MSFRHLFCFSCFVYVCADCGNFLWYFYIMPLISPVLYIYKSLLLSLWSCIVVVVNCDWYVYIFIIFWYGRRYSTVQYWSTTVVVHLCMSPCTLSGLVVVLVDVVVVAFAVAWCCCCDWLLLLLLVIVGCCWLLLVLLLFLFIVVIVVSLCCCYCCCCLNILLIPV